MARVSRKWRGIGAAALLACAGALAGCSPARTASPPGAAAETPVRGGTLRIWTEEPTSLDPALSASVYESVPVNQIFDGLVATDPGLNVVPALASSWTISRDGCTYLFRLRPGVRWHDGRPLTAEDVAFTVRRVLSPGHVRRGLAGPYLNGVRGAAAWSAGRARDLPGVRVVDPGTVEITLERPYLSFLEVLAMDGLRIVPRHVVERLGDERFGRQPVGTGPFRFVSWTDRGIELEANPDAFGPRPHLDRVHIRFPGPEGSDGEREFLAGELDVVDVASDTLELSGDARYRVHRYQELSVNFLGLQTGAPPWDDARVRQAVACAIDRRALVAGAPGRRREATGILPPGLPGYSPAPKTLPHDLPKVRALLAEAGYPDGRGLRPLVIYTAGKSAASREVTDRIREDLQAVGIPVDVRTVSWGEMTARLEDHDAPGFLLAWVADLADPDAFLRTLFASGAASNYFNFVDQTADRLLEEGSRELNPVQRARTYRTAEGRILDLAPLVPLYHSIGTLAVRREVHGFETGPLGFSNVPLEKIWLEPGGERP